MDLATLGIRVEGQEVAAADAQLDGLAAAATKAETATDKLAAAARGNGAAMMTMNAAVEQQRDVLLSAANATGVMAGETGRLLKANNGFASATTPSFFNPAQLAMVQRGFKGLDQDVRKVRAGFGLTATEGLNLSRQMSDVGVTMAMGMSPFMILVQQGPQVMDIFQQAAIRTQTTVGQVANQMAASWMKALWPLIPIIAAIGLAVGGVAAAFGLAARGINQDAKSVQSSLGLTADQMEHLKKKGVETGVTMGDVWNGIGATISKVLKETFGEEVQWAQKQWSEFVDGTADVAFKAARHILASYLTGYFGIRDTWKMLPAVIGDVTATTANVVIAGIEQMLNRGRDGINRFIIAAKGMAAVMPGMGLVAGLSTIDPVSLGRVTNNNPGAIRTAQGAWMNAGRQGPATADQILSGIGTAAVASRDRRVRTGLEDYKAPNEAADAAERMQRAVSAANDNIEVMDEMVRSIDVQPIEAAFLDIITPLERAADELRVIDDLARDMGRGLSSAFGQSGRAMGDMLSTLTSYRAQMAAWQAEEESGQADFLRLAEINAQRGQAQVGVYGDMAAAARGFFEEGSTGYKVLLAIEQAYRIQQMIGMVQAMAMGSTETASSVANSATRGAASMAAGAAKMFEALGPWAFPAVAAMLGLLAGLGLRGSGGGGKSGPSPANDNGPVETTDAVRAQTTQQGQAQSTALAGMAQRVQVMVTADRDGLNAYVVSTAQKVAAPMAVQSGQIAAKVGQNNTEAALARRQAYTVRGG